MAKLADFLIYVYPIFALVIASSFFDAERDTIRFRPEQSWFPKWKYWIRQGTNWSQKSLFVRTIVASFGDGWHLCKTIHLWCLYLVISYLFCICLGYQTIYSIAGMLFLWFVNGLIFETSYGDQNG